MTLINLECRMILERVLAMVTLHRQTDLVDFSEVCGRDTYFADATHFGQ
jgi:hypothetical protein